MAKRGQPTKMTVQIIDKLKQAFAFDATVEEACSYAEIAKQTYYTFIKNNPKILDEFQAQREKPILIARQSVVNKMKEDGHLALKYLERKRKDEFSLRTETDITTQGNPFNSITVTYIDKLESEGNETSEDNTRESSAV